MKNFFNIKIKNRNDNRGFTLIELLVVVAIIGILSSVVLASLNSARSKARDARRRSDLNQIRTALVMYFNETGSWMETGSGCGYNGDGWGWFNMGGNGMYPKSIMQCLVDAGVAKQTIIDPTGSVGGSSPTNSIYSYMKGTCGSKTYVCAKLETIPQSSTALDWTSCYGDWDTSYGMNYCVFVE